MIELTNDALSFVLKSRLFQWDRNTADVYQKSNFRSCILIKVW